MPSLSDILVIFDCDGVLVDGERLAVAIDVRAIGALGWPITQSEVIDRHLGRSSADVLAAIEVHLGRQVPVDWDEAWNAEYRRVFDERLEPVPGVAEAITAIAASSGSHEKMRRT
jgi:beta-phosphoglucomutase-like phosphatase (HAD superfamily)